MEASLSDNPKQNNRQKNE